MFCEYPGESFETSLLASTVELPGEHRPQNDHQTVRRSRSPDRGFVAWLRRVIAFSGNEHTHECLLLIDHEESSSGRVRPVPQRLERLRPRNVGYLAHVLSRPLPETDERDERSGGVGAEPESGELFDCYGARLVGEIRRRGWNDWSSLSKTTRRGSSGA